MFDYRWLRSRVTLTIAAVLCAGVLTRDATAQAASVSASPSTVAPGGNITATWSVGTPAAQDWVGVYPSAATADTSFISWAYTGGAASGSKAVPIPAGAVPGGTYELRLFANNGFTRLATSGAFTVGTASVQASPSSVAPGGNVTATWSVATPATYDWVGVYPSAATADTSFISWAYTGGAASGSKPVPIPAGAVPGSTYELRLFANNGFTRLATSGTFTVGTASVQASPSSVAPGGNVTATWSVATPATYDWVGVYPSAATADSGYLAWTYTGGAATGSKPITIPANAVPGGTYELRLFANNSFNRLATSGRFTVGGTTIQASPSSVMAGGSVTAAWTVVTPTTLDWVGVYPSAATADSAYLSWGYTNGTASGSKAIPIPAGAVPGNTYELRLFTNNSFNRLAVSGSFTVAAATCAYCGSDDYPYSPRICGHTGSCAGTDDWGFTKQQCVSFVAWRLSQRGVAVSGATYGNAGNWDAAAKSLGYTFDDKPVVGDVAQWQSNEPMRWDNPDGSWQSNAALAAGHVAYVTAVHTRVWRDGHTDQTVDLEEYNMNGDQSYHQEFSVKAPRYIHF